MLYDSFSQWNSFGTVIYLLLSRHNCRVVCSSERVLVMIIVRGMCLKGKGYELIALT